MRAKAARPLQAVLIVLAGAFVFAPARHGGWLWDDAAEVTDNPLLRSGSGLGRIWAAPQGPDYLPLKSTVQWLEWRAWGADPTGYHWVSVGLHLFGALLLWAALDRLIRLAGGSEPALRWAWFGALVFAIHPLAVESVAWISELKNTLSLPLFLLSFLAYLIWDGRGGRASWIGSILAFAAALLCKGSVVMLPCILLLYAWWRRGRIGKKDLAATAPFFALSLAFGLITAWFQYERAMGGRGVAGGGAGAAGRAVWFYLLKTILPARLCLMYPRWPASPAAEAFAWLALVSLAAWFWTRRAGWGRHALFGLGCFALNLIPTLGFIPLAYQRISPVADHFAYLSLLAAGGLAAVLAAAVERRAGRIATGTGAAVLCLALACAARAHVCDFRDEENLWNSVLRRNPKAWEAHNNWGNILVHRGDFEGAIGQFQQALAIEPDDAEAHYDLGNALFREARWSEAEMEYRRALQLDPALAPAHYNLARTLVQLGRNDEAIGEYQATLRAQPNHEAAAYNLGNAFFRSGRLAEAVAAYKEALAIRPDDAAARANLERALSAAGEGTP